MEHSGIDIITMEEYLNREAMTGKLKDKNTGEVIFPPNNRTDWNKENNFPQELKNYLRYFFPFLQNFHCFKHTYLHCQSHKWLLSYN